MEGGWDALDAFKDSFQERARAVAKGRMTMEEATKPVGLARRKRIEAEVERRRELARRQQQRDGAHGRGEQPEAGPEQSRHHVEQSRHHPRTDDSANAEDAMDEFLQLYLKRQGLRQYVDPRADTRNQGFRRLSSQQYGLSRAKTDLNRFGRMGIQLR